MHREMVVIIFVMSHNYLKIQTINKGLHFSIQSGDPPPFLVKTIPMSKKTN